MDKVSNELKKKRGTESLLEKHEKERKKKAKKDKKEPKVLRFLCEYLKINKKSMIFYMKLDELLFLYAWFQFSLIKPLNSEH